MIRKKEFDSNIKQIINEAKIENVDIKNIDILKQILNDKRINKSLYDGFCKNYEDEYGSNMDFIFMKIEDMLYRLHLLINYNFIE